MRGRGKSDRTAADDGNGKHRNITHRTRSLRFR
jgi:hypothetical protein